MPPTSPRDAMLFHSTKFDGSLHYRFEVEVVHRDRTLIAVHTAAGTPITSYRGQWLAKHPMLCLYWTDRSWNLAVSWHPDGRPRSHYVNIASPATWSDGVLRCVDLDLDLIRSADEDRVIVDDADEFELHRVKWAYPDDLVATCRETCDAVADLLGRRVPPLDGRLYAWKPGQPLPPLEDPVGVGR